ncbi:hypothetical protein [Leptolyngbya ohadii]|uniref:hypothetical protein n=1 Tax=Leptolyngbya ohadii TaxID=1962290 RepID=UPI001179C0ED|nr:hypothetical protein [Leptolyngbya ohadii]
MTKLTKGNLLRIVCILASLILGITAIGYVPPVFGQANNEPAPFQTQPYPTVKLAVDLTIVSIDAEINRASQTTQVSIRSVGSLLEEIDFELPVTEYSDIERAIAQELNLTPTLIHPLMRYRID